MAALALNTEQCDDVCECEAVDNIIRVLGEYHEWNKKQLKRIGEIDYSVLYKQCGDNNEVIMPQLTKSSASFSTRLTSDYESLISEFMDDISYTEVSLLNDFGHILDCHHMNDREFEWICYELTDKFEIESLLDRNNAIVHRTQYSRDLVYDDIGMIKRLYYGYYESKEIHTFEILDKVYIYFLHSFDFGFRFRANDKMELEIEERQREDDDNKNKQELIHTPEINIDETFNTINRRLSAIKKRLCKFETFRVKLSASNRFITNYNDAMLLSTTRNRTSAKYNMIEEKEEIDNKEAKEAIIETTKEAASVQMEANAHLIGRRWHYSQNVLNSTDIDTINGGCSGDWHIFTKYKNIKHEILNNDIYPLSMNSWIFNYDFAALQMKTKRAKNTLRVMADRWKTFYDNNQNFDNLPNPLSPSIKSNGSNIFDSIQPQHDLLNNNNHNNNNISVNHILAILFYCNFAELSRYFRATYLDSDSFGISRDTDTKWRDQHSEFANFGRLIRETIEDYGESLNDRLFYHGLNGINNEQIVCSSTQIRFCSAVSCTTSNVLQLYSEAESGIILECASYTNYLRFFDAKWLSLAHCAENESIFCGGDWPLRIKSILDLRTMNNYRYYLCTINILSDLISGEYNKECEFINNKVRYTFNQIFSSRLWMRNAIPQYIDCLFEKYCNNLGQRIEINMDYMNVKSNGYQEIKSLLFDEQNDDRIKLDVFCGVFNRSQIFKFSHYKITQKNINYIFTFAKNQYKEYAQEPFSSQLKYIVFEEPNQKHVTLKNIVKIYQKQFKQIQWFLHYKKKKTNSILAIGNQPMQKINSYDSDCLIM